MFCSQKILKTLLPRAVKLGPVRGGKVEPLTLLFLKKQLFYITPSYIVWHFLVALGRKFLNTALWVRRRAFRVPRHLRRRYMYPANWDSCRSGRFYYSSGFLPSFIPYIIYNWYIFIC